MITLMSPSRACSSASACWKVLQFHRVNVSISGHCVCVFIPHICWLSTISYLLIVGYREHQSIWKKKTKLKTVCVCGHFAGINMNSVHFTTSPNTSSHSGGMRTVGYWGEMAVTLHYLQLPCVVNINM